MNGSNELIEELGHLFTETFHVEAPAPDDDLLENGILDSLQLVELLAELERRFGLRLRIEDIDLEDLRTLARIARLVVSGDIAEQHAHS